MPDPTPRAPRPSPPFGELIRVSIPSKLGIEPSAPRAKRVDREELPEPVKRARLHRRNYPR